MRKYGLFFLLLFLFILSCSKIEFVHQNNLNLNNPVYNKTNVQTSGLELVFLKRYVMSYFGNTENPEFDLNIVIKENKIKRSVQDNQAISVLDYELELVYELKNIYNGCVLYTSEIISNFSVTPKSSGYNFGTDASLNNKYEIALSENFERFISSLIDKDLATC